jgi:hypothetical protein
MEDLTMPRVRRRPISSRRSPDAPRDSRVTLHQKLGLPPPPYDIRDDPYPYPVLTAYRQSIGWVDPHRPREPASTPRVIERDQREAADAA